MRHKIRRVTMGKDAIKKSATLIALIGPSSAISAFTLIDVAGGGRLASGNTKIIRQEQDTASECKVGDICKYVNIRIQTGPTGETPEDDNSGWLEWCVVKSKENLVNLTSANLGVKTLGDIATQFYRGDCLLTGAIPVGGDQPSMADIVIKIPKIFCKMQIGSSLTLFFHFRSVNSASVATDINKTVASTFYKLYV